MRAFFAEGADNMHIPWAVEGLPTLLHLSLFFFFGGLAIFLFDVDREVFRYVVWWIGLFCLVYGVITVLPLIRQDSPYNSPLSTPAWFLLATMSYVTVKILSFVIFIFGFGFCLCFRFCFYICSSLDRLDDLDDDSVVGISDTIADLGKYYSRRIVGGVEMAIEEAVSKRLSKVDVRILDWTITTLGDDDSLKNFFEAIPGFINSKLVKHLKGRFPEELRMKYTDTLRGFVDRTLSSNSVSDSEKARRLDISMDAVSCIHDPLSFLRNILSGRWDEVPHTLEMGQSLARWCTSDNEATAAVRIVIARILASVQERNGIWITVASRYSGLPEKDLRENVALGDDSVLLAILIHVARQYLPSDYPTLLALEALSKLNIRHTLPGLQHDFCTLWNEIVQEAKKKGGFSTHVDILYKIRHSYIALHQGTDAAPTAFSASTRKDSIILYHPSSYPLCNLASHRPDSIAQFPVPNSLHIPLSTQPALSSSLADGGNTASRQAEQVKNVVEPPSSFTPTTSEIVATSHRPGINPVHSSSLPIGASPPAVAAAVPQDATSAATFSHPLEGSEQQNPDIVVPSAEPETNQILSTASTHPPTPTLPPIPTSLPNSDGTCFTSASDSSHFAPPSFRSSIPASRPTGSATLLRLRARGLVNTRNICFANAVLQLLVNLPPSRSPLTELCDLKGRRRAGAFETGGGATPLVDATARFLKEFMTEELPSTEQRSQSTTGRLSRPDGEKEDGDVVDSFEPTYMYDAMKEKRQLKSLLVRFRDHVATSRY